MKRTKARILFVTVWLAVLFSGIAYVFWYSDWQYSLPTPMPKNYHAVQQGTHTGIDERLHLTSSRPKFIHFFNPSCPCSRFNMAHFKSLVRQYGNKIDFAIVVMNKNTSYTEHEIQEKYDLRIPVSFDTSLAGLCGVYSTPQAVLLNNDGSLYYRGNYNKSRYCTNKETNFAQIAIENMLGHTPAIIDKRAFTAYGCQLPTCKK